MIIALTDKGLNDSDLVNHETEYYKDVINYFEKFKNEKVVLHFNAVLQKEWWKYFYLKMDAYVFGSKNGKIINNGIYDRVNWDYLNTILPFIEELESFYRKTNFSKFYINHQHLYNSQIKYFKHSINISEMQQWLNKYFPSTSYNCYKVIFLPLVGGSQSANKFDNNGFKEAQVHINFPYPNKLDKIYSAKAKQLRNGSIAFTELNHSYINPEAEKYSMNENFITAFKDLKNWEAENSTAFMGYPKALACFEEYMNWALVSLFYLDKAPKDEQEKLISKIENNIQVNRGVQNSRNLIKNLSDFIKKEVMEKLLQTFILLLLNGASNRQNKQRTANTGFALVGGQCEQNHFRTRNSCGRLTVLSSKPPLLVVANRQTV